MRKIAIIGLGRFGMGLARHLGNTNAQVIAIDADPQLVEEIKDDVDVAVRLDSTDQHALLSQEIDEFDVCVVSIGENFEAALLTTVILKKLNIPKIICRAQSEFHAEIFRQIGAHEIIQPESESGRQLARRLANPQLEDYMELAEGVSLVEIKAPRDFWNHSLQELRLRNRFQVNLIAIRRQSPANPESPASQQKEFVIGVPGPDEVIRQDDTLLLLGDDHALARLPRD